MLDLFVFATNISLSQMTLVWFNLFREFIRKNRSQNWEKQASPAYFAQFCLLFLRRNSLSTINIRLIVTIQDPLDDTRIHPGDYRLAAKMASDALDREGDDDYIIEQIFKKPKKLDEIGKFVWLG